MLRRGYWATRKTGRGVRLPTEAEWEYACRAGTRSRWSSGDDIAVAADFGWSDQNSEWRTHPVGRKKPNAWGLFDMHGNVWEWAQDWGGPYGTDTRDPAGPLSGQFRSIRGGGWSGTPVDGRSATRFQFLPTYRHTDLGFRVALP